MAIDTLRELILASGIMVALVFVLYVAGGAIISTRYVPRRADKKAENVALAITTIASESVQDALYETIEHTQENFGEYDLYCVVDEGSDLQSELAAWSGIDLVVVPASFSCTARAKGRAIHYFIETVVEGTDDMWYGFIDDDNLVLDDEFLYEIPAYADDGYVAMNPILTPREGGSLTTFVADNMRLVDDLTVFRAFTGLLGKPYLGFHGELLVARGDVLRDVGFDFDTMVEDFVFAMHLLDDGYRTWQSDTRVSVLSPHTIREFYHQRRRWFLGILEYLPDAPIKAKVVVGSRSLLWVLGFTGSWVLFPLWLWSGGLSTGPIIQSLVVLAGIIYVISCFLSVRVVGWRGIFIPFLVPICSLMEHTAPWYGILRPNTDFVVIEK